MFSQVSKLLLSLVEGGWKIDMPLDPCCTYQGSMPSGRWLRSLDPLRFIPVQRDDFSTVLCVYNVYGYVEPLLIQIQFYSVRHRPHQVLVSLSHQSPAYLDEDYPITIEITNEDDRELDLIVDVLLQPTEIDDAGMTSFTAVALFLR